MNIVEVTYVRYYYMDNFDIMNIIILNALSGKGGRKGLFHHLTLYLHYWVAY